MADDWPQWMGPTRDGIWKEPGITRAFPKDGPRLKWEKPLGGGYSGPAVAGGRVFVMDYRIKTGDPTPDPSNRNQLTGTERIVCFDSTTGTQQWDFAYSCPYHVSYPVGPRCTPTVHDGKVYALGTMGHLNCLTVDGNPVWNCDFTTKFAAKVPRWGFAGHPLVYKNLLICLVGGQDGLMIAFDKQTGEVKWKSLSTPDDGPGYCPPTLIEAGGVMQLVIWHPQAIVSVNPDTGKEYWREELKPSYDMSIMMPRQQGNLLFVGGYSHAAIALKLDAQSPKASVHWRGDRHNALHPANSTPIMDGDVIYGCDHMGVLRAVKIDTGERLWETSTPIVNASNKQVPHGTAFLVKNDDHYFLFNEKGSLVIAKLTHENYSEVARAQLIEPTTPAFNRKVVWSHPAFAEKSIFVRNDKTIKCYSLAR